MEKWQKMMLTGLASIALAACGNGTDDGTVTPNEPAGNGAATTGPVEEPGGTDTATDTTTGTPTDPMADLLTMNEALDIYWAEYPDAEIEEIDFDDDDHNEWTYEITGVFENREYEVEIDARTGDIIQTDEDDADTDEEYITFDNLIEPEEAISIARQQVSDDADLEGWNLDMDDGHPEFEVEFEGSDDRDVKIHGESGEVLEIDS